MNNFKRVLTPSSLPPLTTIQNYAAAHVSRKLDNLKSLYWPGPYTLAYPRHITVKKPPQAVPDSGYASAEEDDSETDSIAELRADPFERQFAIKWLTGFVASSDKWISLDDQESDEHVMVLEEASRILSAFTAGVGNDTITEYAVTRRFDFASSTGNTIHVELNDAPLLDDDHTSVGLQSWGSSIILAQKVCSDPSRFLPTQCVRPIRLLELGAGTGMLTITVAKLLDPKDLSMIVATDYHPRVLENLSDNIGTNCPSMYSEASVIDICTLDWSRPSFLPPLDRPFDIVLAADVIYHPDHALWVRNCVEKLLVQPSASDSPAGIFWLVIPVRSIGRHEGVDRTVEDLFPLVVAGTSEKTELGILEQEDIARQANIGRADEDGYRLFKIGWGRRI